MEVMAFKTEIDYVGENGIYQVKKHFWKILNMFENASQATPNFLGRFLSRYICEQSLRKIVQMQEGTPQCQNPLECHS